MRIVCPDCDAAYEVSDALLEGRKTVRCARCGGSWPPVDIPLSPHPAPVIEPIAEERLAAPFQAPPAGAIRLALPAAWAASLVIVAAAIVLLLVEHRTLAAAWPPLRRLYAALGVQ